jgi:hypothetical protein
MQEEKRKGSRITPLGRDARGSRERLRKKLHAFEITPGERLNFPSKDYLFFLAIPLYLR